MKLAVENNGIGCDLHHLINFISYGEIYYVTKICYMI